jgi:hypothetical protein
MAVVSGARNRRVRFPPDSDQTADTAGGPFRAISGLMHRSNAAFSKGAGRWDNSSMLSEPWHFAFV